jgi:hypothetical protein
MHVEPGVEIVVDHRLTRVDPDPDPDRLALPLVLGERLLTLRGRRHPLPRERKREEERVALHLHLDTAVVPEDLAQQSPVLRERANVRVTAQLLKQPRRSLDVREDQRDCTAGNLRHGLCQSVRRSVGRA